MVVCANTIPFLLATKLKRRGSAAKIFMSNLKSGIPPSGSLNMGYTDMSIRVLRISVLEDLEGTVLS